LKLRDYVQYTDAAIKKIENKYFAELFFFKLLIHYMMRPEGSSLLPKIEEQMITLLTKARNFSTEQAKDLVEKKIRKKKQELKDQTKLNFENEDEE